MKVVIWGAGKGYKKAEEVCKAMGWEILFAVDSDPEKCGKLIGEIQIKSPDSINNTDGYDLVMIGTASKDVNAKIYDITSSVIDWNAINKIHLGIVAFDDSHADVELREENVANCRVLSSRLVLLDKLKDAYEDNEIIAAEIGVAFGDYSQEILKRCNPKKLFLIDVWESERYGKGRITVENKFAEEIASGKIELLQGYSTQMLNNLEDESLDIAYIDTAHTYDVTWNELLLCAKKVKKNGYICGHDYVNISPVSRLQYGVVEAVNKFCVEYNYEMAYITMETLGYHSFALRKMN